IVYYLERNPRYFDAAAEWMERVNDGRLTAAASVLLLAEVLVPAYRARNPAAARQARAALERVPNLELVEVTAGVSDVAARLRAEHNLRTPDALHVATALREGAGWLVTNDRRLQRVEAEGVRVWLFDDHVN
ncbi:MAG TPA: PIN domain-containing protein, partial [Longimicrobium sp.]|nr:PIN domain-containing protein [Longimicrobium sp.]